MGSVGPAHRSAGAETQAGAALWLEVGSVRWVERGGGGTMPCWALPCQAIHQSAYTHTYLPTVPHQWAGSVYLPVCKPTNQTTEWGHRRRRGAGWQQVMLGKSSVTVTHQTCDVQESLINSYYLTASALSAVVSSYISQNAFCQPAQSRKEVNVSFDFQCKSRAAIRS